MIFKKWPINVVVYIERAGSSDGFLDKARPMIDKETGKKFFRLKLLKENVDSVHFNHMVRTNKGLHITLYSPAAGQFFPCKLQNKEKSLIWKDETGKEHIKKAKGIEPINQDRMNFYADQVDMAHRMRSDKHGFIEKYMPLIAVFMVVFAIGFLLFFLDMWGNPLIHQASNDAAAKWDQVAARAAYAMSYLEPGSPMLQRLCAEAATPPLG